MMKSMCSSENRKLSISEWLAEMDLGIAVRNDKSYVSYEYIDKLSSNCNWIDTMLSIDYVKIFTDFAVHTSDALLLLSTMCNINPLTMNFIMIKKILMKTRDKM